MLKQIYVYITTIKRKQCMQISICSLEQTERSFLFDSPPNTIYLFFHFSVTPLSQLEQESIDSSRSKRKKRKEKRETIITLGRL